MRRFAGDRSGLTLVEYAVAGGLIALAVVGASLMLGSTVTRKIDELALAVVSAGIEVVGTGGGESSAAAAPAPGMGAPANAKPGKPGKPAKPEKPGNSPGNR